MERPSVCMLGELQGGQRTVGGPYLGRPVSSGCHPIEGLLADANRCLESLHLHRVRAVVAAALHGHGRLHPGDFAQQVPPPEAHGLGPEVAWGVVRDRSRGGSEVRVESVLVADRPQELRRVQNGLGDLRRAFSVLRGHQARVLAAQHHGAGRIDGQHLLAGIHVRFEAVQVGGGPRLEALQVAGLPGRHSAAHQALLTGDLHAVALQHRDRVTAHLRLVVLDVAGGEQDGLAIGRVI